MILRRDETLFWSCLSHRERRNSSKVIKAICKRKGRIFLYKYRCTVHYLAQSINLFGRVSRVDVHQYFGPSAHLCFVAMWSIVNEFSAVHTFLIVEWYPIRKYWKRMSNYVRFIVPDLHLCETEWIVMSWFTTNRKIMRVSRLKYT